MNAPARQPIDEADKVGDDPTIPIMGGKANGRLEDWVIIEAHGQKRAYGYCKEHNFRKDLLGRRITTSPIQIDHSDRGYIETMNTIYQLGEPSEDRPYQGTEE